MLAELTETRLRSGTSTGDYRQIQVVEEYAPRNERYLLFFYDGININSSCVENWSQNTSNTSLILNNSFMKDFLRYIEINQLDEDIELILDSRPIDIPNSSRTMKARYQIIGKAKYEHTEDERLID